MNPKNEFQVIYEVLENQIQEEVVVEDEEGRGEKLFSTFVPKSSRSMFWFNSSISCKGCNRCFPCQKKRDEDEEDKDKRENEDEEGDEVIPVPPYFLHCVEGCDQYQALGLIKCCEECRLLFIDSISFDYHQKEVHPKRRKETGQQPLAKACLGSTNTGKVEEGGETIDEVKVVEHLKQRSGPLQEKPKWMAKYFYKRSQALRFNTSVECIGCGTQFSSFRRDGNKGHIHSFEYYVHCIDECKSYQNLGLITSCDDCELKFLNDECLRCHRSQCQTKPRNAGPFPEKPEWMTMSLYEKITSSASFPHQVDCKGCGKGFPSITYKNSTKSLYSMEFYVHCIESCDEYKKLGLIAECIKCGCKFLANTSLASHKKSCR